MIFQVLKSKILKILRLYNDFFMWPRANTFFKIGPCFGACAGGLRRHYSAMMLYCIPYSDQLYVFLCFFFGLSLAFPRKMLGNMQKYISYSSVFFVFFLCFFVEKRKDKYINMCFFSGFSWAFPRKMYGNMRKYIS